ncbi:MAG: hypothetical protein LBM70_01420 [Victivallales bacterium]|jgi:capsular polysaccharide biosynthesis protein|nr:hypothetical protein [Victivallales bacterium]
MDNSTNIQLDAEQERLRQFELYRKLCIAVLLKHWKLIVIITAVTFICMLTLMRIMESKSADRYQAATRLFYYPKETKNCSAMDIRQAKELFARRTLFQQVTERLHLTEPIGDRVTISTEKTRPNLIIVTARARNAEQAVQLANTVAELCIEEYTNFRTSELNTRLLGQQERKRMLESAVANDEREQHRMVPGGGSLSPVQELDRLREIVGSAQSLLSSNRIEYANEKLRYEKLESQLKGMDPNALRLSGQLNDFLTRLEQQKKEVERLRLQYTDKNPRLVAAREELAYQQKNYEAFLKDNKIDSYDPESIRQAEGLRAALTASLEKLDLYTEKNKALAEEIAKNRDIITKLTDLLPKYTEIGIRRGATISILHTVEENISDLQLLLGSTKNDITQVERAESAAQRGLFNKKTIALILAAAFIVTGGACVLLVLFQIFFGKVERLEELEAVHGLTTLGTYPDSPERFSTPGEQEIVLHEIYYKLKEVLEGKNIMFEGTLDGGVPHKEIRDAIEWNAAMNGVRCLRISIVSALGFEPIENSGDGDDALVAVQMSGSQGCFPVDNTQALSPAELELLGCDTKELLKKYDLLIIVREQPLVQNDLFFRQMMEFCDCSLLFVEAGGTPRRMLRLASVLQRRCEHAVAVVLTGVKKWTPNAGVR